MKFFTTYECELCGYTSRDQAEVLACEAAGTPPLPDWAKSRIGQQVRGFGERGVQWGTLEAVELRRTTWGEHYWFAVGNFWLSYNQSADADGVSLSALDPMSGWDFLRSCDDNDVRSRIREWAVCCMEYGIEPDPAKALWFDMRGECAQQVVLAALAKWRAETS